MPLSLWQAKRQVAWWIARQAWTDTPQGLVITGGAFASEDEPGNFRPGDREVDGPVAIGLMTDGGFKPFVIVTRDNAVWDRESMARIERTVLRARIVAGGGFGSLTTVAGIDPGSKGNTSAAGYDTHGLNQVTGALRATPNGQGQSQGRDVDELLDRLAELVGEGGFIDSIHGFQGRLSDSPSLGTVHGVQVLENDAIIEVVNAIASNCYPTVFGLAGSQVPSAAFTFSGTTLTGYTFTVTIDGTPTVFSAISGATTEIAAAALATAINAHAIASKVFADASRNVVSVTPLASTSLTTLTGTVTPGGTGGQASVSNSTKTALLKWSAPPLRFDSLALQVRRGTNSGDAAPTTPGISDGAGISHQMPNETRFADTSTGPGTWNYAVFPEYAETPGGWPTLTILGLALTSYVVTVLTTGGDFQVAVPGGASLAAAATALAATINASGASAYTLASASGAVVTLKPTGTPAWLDISVTHGPTDNQMDRTVGDRYARSTLQIVVV